MARRDGEGDTGGSVRPEYVFADFFSAKSIATGSREFFQVTKEKGAFRGDGQGSGKADKRGPQMSLPRVTNFLKGLP